ncbi:hypothetical protein DW322_14145 [Rhodococcus rhodnii]|uniref:Uncharacterized protein n=2 Tax=Rhodococcus rhodnii TaxID=38312 RepID=R7WIM1_9NOCA|nr:hypothetical protein [Rhodococcus rhodnii]EOM75051.1 hypothetical protein Rrhod_3664 [Rhodococcus rhodnii LMG 5362]TXG92708.1 hypothetical protein DW322_14145 [Rhodococcus rhodnii]
MLVAPTSLAAFASPLESSRDRLRDLNPEYPRMYAVAAMMDEGKRRWWALADAPGNDRVGRMYRRVLLDLPDPEAAALQVADSLIHAVVGRVAALIVLEGRAWDPGVENLWIHMDNDEGADWAGVLDEVVRVLPDDPAAGMPGTVTLPCERALAVWTAHRCLSSLTATLTAVTACAPVDPARFWSSVGQSILGAAGCVPLLAGGGESTGHRRGQLLLDAFTAAGVPVRRRVHPYRTSRRSGGRARRASLSLRRERTAFV